MKKEWIGFLIIVLIFIGLMAEDFKFGKVGGEGSYPPDVDFERSVEEVLDKLLSQKIFNSVWNDFFHYFTNFDSMEASTGDNTFEETGSIAVTLDGWEVATEVDVTAASFMQKVQIPTLGAAVALNRNLSWNQPQRFRANFSFYDSTDTNDPQHTSYLVRGVTPQSNYDHPYFGFKITDTTLYGVCRDSSGGGESTVSLMTVANATAYIVEVRYAPADKIIFLVQNNSTLKMEEKGTLIYGTHKLPNPSNANTSTFYGMEITREENHTVQFVGSFFEYIQKIRKF